MAMFTWRLDLNDLLNEVDGIKESPKVGERLKDS